MKSTEPALVAVKRTMYAITGRSGQYVINVASDGPVFSPMASEAIATQHAWMDSTTAAARADALRANFPGVPLHIALLELEANGPGNWRVVSTRSFGAGLSTTIPAL